MVSLFCSSFSWATQSGSERVLAPVPNLDESRMHLNENLYAQISPARLPVSPSDLLRRYFDRSILNLSEFELVEILGNRPLPSVVVKGRIASLVGSKVMGLISCKFVLKYDPVNFPIWFVDSETPAECQHYPDVD